MGDQTIKRRNKAKGKVLGFQAHGMMTRVGFVKRICGEGVASRLEYSLRKRSRDWAPAANVYSLGTAPSFWG